MNSFFSSVHPKSTKDSGGFKIETMVEFLITDESYSSESESSQIESEYSLRPLPLSEPLSTTSSSSSPSNNELPPTSSLEKIAQNN